MSTMSRSTRVRMAEIIAIMEEKESRCHNRPLPEAEEADQMLLRREIGAIDRSLQSVLGLARCTANECEKEGIRHRRTLLIDRIH